MSSLASPGRGDELAGLVAEHDQLSAAVADLDRTIRDLLTQKDEAEAAVEGIKQLIRGVQTRRDPLRARQMTVGTLIGELEGRPPAQGAGA